MNDKEFQVRQDEEREVRGQEPTDVAAIERSLSREDDKGSQQRKHVEPVDAEKDDMIPSSLRRSKRERKEPVRFEFNKDHGYTMIKGVCSRVLKCLKQDRSDISYLYALLMDSESGCMENIPANMIETPSILKASHVDPDTPNLQEALNGKYREEFLEAMGKDISELEGHKTWNVVPRKSVKKGAKVLPSTWAFKIK